MNRTDDTYTVKEAADLLGISRYQVYRRIVRGDLKATQARTGNIHYLISRQAIADYIAAGGGDVLTPPRLLGPEMMRVSEVAIETGYSVEAIRGMCADGTLPCVRGVGPRGHFRIPREAVDELLSTARR